MTQISPTSVALTPEQLMGWGLARRLEWEQRRDRWLQGVPPPPEDQHPQLTQAIQLLPRGLLPSELGRLLRWSKQWIHRAI